MDSLFQIIILIFSVVVHEVAHGAMAYYLGDMTAKREGRLTLNPIPHVDMMGSVILPLLMVATHSPILFGWAKPVPYNPYNLRKGGRWSESLVAFAGPASNFILALLFGLALRIGMIPAEAYGIAVMAVYINILLGIFNLIPIPPLDGSKILPTILPRPLAVEYARLMRSFTRNPLLGFAAVIVIVMILGASFSTFIATIAQYIIGM